MKKLSLLLIAPLFIFAAKGQVQTSKLYVAGTVLSDEKMLVSVRGTKTIEGNVVIAEMNGKKTEMKTDNKGHALLDFSSIAAGLVNPTVAVIKSFDKNGSLISTATTTVQAGGSRTVAAPVIEELPANLPKGEAVTIPGRNLGADAKMTIGNQAQEILSASDKEMTVFTNANPGQQPLYVTTPNGVSQSQMVNIYSLDFALPKNSITPRENVQAMVHYESIPVGTKLLFTNKSPGTISMNIPGAENAANESIYTVADKNGSMPVNITGVTKGDFKIALDYNFKNEPVKNNTGPGVYNDNSDVQSDDPCDKIIHRIKLLENRITELQEELRYLEGRTDKYATDRKKTAMEKLLKHIETQLKLKDMLDDCLDGEVI